MRDNWTHTYIYNARNTEIEGWFQLDAADQGHYWFQLDAADQGHYSAEDQHLAELIR